MTNPTALKYFREFVFSESANVVDDTKDYLLEARLAPVAKAAGLKGLDALAGKLRQGCSVALREQIVEALTTNETYFFRDAHPFETLKVEVLPRLVAARRQTRALRIWCAAASTGQEPYSIAMVLREAIPDIAAWSIEIAATDINRRVLKRAADGVYRQHEVDRGLPATMVRKHFTRRGTDWVIDPSLRAMVNFSHLNLRDSWPLAGSFDLVFLRNVLIYFDMDTKKDILRRVRPLMSPDGVLFLGGAETTVSVDDTFKPVRFQKTVYYEKRT